MTQQGRQKKDSKKSLELETKSKRSGDTSKGKLNLKEIEIDCGEVKYLFLVPKSSRFGQLDALEYLSRRAAPEFEEVEEEQQTEPSELFIPDEPYRNSLFRSDLGKGIDFVCQKYGKTKQEVFAQAKHLGLEKLIGG